MVRCCDLRARPSYSLFVFAAIAALIFSSPACFAQRDLAVAFVAAGLSVRVEYGFRAPALRVSPVDASDNRPQITASDSTNVAFSVLTSVSQPACWQASV